MQCNFKVEALDHTKFEHLFAQSDTELARIGAKRAIVDKKPGYPCRISLEDAAVGEEVILFPYAHHDVPSPYRSSGPIFIRKNVKTAKLGVNELPKTVFDRKLALRAYDKNAMMVEAKTVSGTMHKEAIFAILQHHEVAYIHIHNAGPGCYNCSIIRVD